MHWRPQIDAYEPSLVVAVDQASKFVAEMRTQSARVQIPAHPIPMDKLIPREGRWITFAGACGCGKTMIARQIYEEGKRCNPARGAIWIGPRPECAFWEELLFAQELRNGHWDLPESLRDHWLVVIDDLGASRDNTAFIAEALLRVANVRLGRWTVWTSNLGQQEVADRIDMRLASRLIRGRNAFVPISAADYANR